MRRLVLVVAILMSSAEQWPTQPTILVDLAQSCEKHVDDFGRWLPSQHVKTSSVAFRDCVTAVILRSYQEPSLTEGSATESYRVIWTPSFAAPVVIRVESSHGGYVAVVKRDRSNATDEALTGHFDTTVTKLSASDFAKVRAAAGGAGCWTGDHTCYAELSALPDPGGGEVIVVADGESWTLEGSRATEYWGGVAVGNPRWGPFMEVCAALVKAARAQAHLRLPNGSTTKAWVRPQTRDGGTQ